MSNNEIFNLSVILFPISFTLFHFKQPSYNRFTEKIRKIKCTKEKVWDNLKDILDLQ